MPDWVKNKVRAVNKDDTQKLIAMLVRDGDNGKCTNFNGIIPMPEELMSTEVSSTEESNRKQAANKVKYGYSSWYDFGVHKWGTKWDYNGVIINGDVIEFDTAWSMPDGVYTEIAKTIPIIVAYADEDIGCNYGVVRYDADMKEDIPIGGTDCQIANAIWGHEYVEGDDWPRKEDVSEDVKAEIEKIFAE